MIMKTKIILLFIASCFFTACEDFLQREPLDYGSEVNYFGTASDLFKAANQFYTLFPGNNQATSHGLFTVDNNSDNQCGGGSNNDFYPGFKMTPELTNDANKWKFETVRQCNYLIGLTEERKGKGEITGSEKDINHALGEFYFFRAYYYYNNLLTTLGDVPILKDVQADDFDDLVKNSARQPRNEVARFIIEDLEKAKTLLGEQSPEVGRVNRDCAVILLARAALFEATFEKYHANTAFVPGNPKWVGNGVHPDFTFESGSAEAEVNFFLDKAIENAKEVSEKRVLYDNYSEMFVMNDVNSVQEMILVKNYKVGVNAHSVPKTLGAGSDNCGYTQAMVNSFLMTDGSPVYASEAYVNERRDTSIVEELKDRDLRLVTSVNKPGDINKVFPDHTEYLELPRITNVSETGSPTGYEIRKFHVTKSEFTEYYSTCETTTPIFRVAEAYLIYLEAYYEKNKNLDSYCDKYWRALRRRAGVNEDYTFTIGKTDLNKENDLAVWSKGVMVDETLYNIRRERRCEFIAEGFRLDDLHRWRALDMMNRQGDKSPIANGYVMRGFNLWSQYYTRYTLEDLLKEGVVSLKEDGMRICPHRRYTTDNAYEGYNFPKPHYLEPIPVSEIILTSQNSDVTTSTIYQNPGWPAKSSGPADENYDCD